MQGNGNLAGPMFVGVKLVGDTYVPAGEESTRVNTTDGTVRILLHCAVQPSWCFIVQPSWCRAKRFFTQQTAQSGHNLLDWFMGLSEYPIEPIERQHQHLT